MKRVQLRDALDQMLESENYGTTVWREGGSIIVAVGARKGAAQCAYFNSHQAREIAQHIINLADEVDRGEP